jgi:hypothetical protein
LQHTFTPFVDVEDLVDLRFPFCNLSIQLLALFEFLDLTSFFFSCAAFRKSVVCCTTFGSTFSCPLLGSFVGVEDALSLSSNCGETESSAFSNNKQHSSELAIFFGQSEKFMG